jgi:hypothetical protein
MKKVVMIATLLVAVVLVWSSWISPKNSNSPLVERYYFELEDVWSPTAFI